MTSGDQRRADRLDDLADRLAAVAAELDDLAFDALREAAAAGATQRPEADRRLTQARRAIDKAVMLLRGRPELVD